MMVVYPIVGWNLCQWRATAASDETRREADCSQKRELRDPPQMSPCNSLDASNFLLTS